MNRLFKTDEQKYLLTGLACLYLAVLTIIILVCGSLKYATNSNVDGYFYCLYLVSGSCIFFVTIVSAIVALFVFADASFEKYKCIGKTSRRNERRNNNT